MKGIREAVPLAKIPQIEKRQQTNLLVAMTFESTLATTQNQHTNILAITNDLVDDCWIFVWASLFSQAFRVGATMNGFGLKSFDLLTKVRGGVRPATSFLSGGWLEGIEDQQME